MLLFPRETLRPCSASCAEEPAPTSGRKRASSDQGQSGDVGDIVKKSRATLSGNAGDSLAAAQDKVGMFSLVVKDRRIMLFSFVSSPRYS